MKVRVAVKRAVDYNVKVRVKSNNTGVNIANVKMSITPFDEIAVSCGVQQSHPQPRTKPRHATRTCTQARRETSGTLG